MAYAEWNNRRHSQKKHPNMCVCVCHLRNGFIRVDVQIRSPKYKLNLTATNCMLCGSNLHRYAYTKRFDVVLMKSFDEWSPFSFGWLDVIQRALGQTWAILSGNIHDNELATCLLYGYNQQNTTLVVRCSNWTTMVTKTYKTDDTLLLPNRRLLVVCTSNCALIPIARLSAGFWCSVDVDAWNCGMADCGSCHDLEFREKLYSI